MVEAYKIGVQIAMSSNGGAVLGTLLRQFTGLHIATDKLTGKLNAVKLAAIGAGAAIGGIAVLRGLGDMIEKGKALNAELVKTNQLGGQFSATLAQARATAFKSSAVVGNFSPDEFVRIQRELGTQLGSPEAGFAMAPTAAKAAYVASSYTGENPEDMVKNLIKVADIRGQIFSKDASGKEVVDPAKVAAEMQSEVRALVMAGGLMKSGDLLTLARQAAVPAKGMTSEAFYATLVEAAISLGASRAGTATTSLFSQFVGGQMPVHTAVEMQRLGLIGKKEWKSDHGHIVLGHAASERLSGAMKDPIAFIEGPLNDLMDKKHMSASDKLMEVFRLYGRATTQRLAADAMTNGPQFARARKIYGSILGVDEQYKEIMDKSLDANLDSLTKAWKGLSESLSSAATPAVISLLKSLTDAIKGMSAFSEAHPRATVDILKITAGLAALSIAVGSLAVGVAAISTLAGAIGTLGGGVAAAAAVGMGAVAVVMTELAVIGIPPVLRWLVRALNGGDVDPSMRTRIGSEHAGQIPHGVSPFSRGMPGGRGAGSSPQTPMYTHETNTGGLAAAHISGLAGTFYSGATGPAGGDITLAPHLPGH